MYMSSLQSILNGRWSILRRCGTPDAKSEAATLVCSLAET